jgi:hypothetical protein
MNGKMNGGAVAQPMQQMQVNPVEVARIALTFLQRVQFTAAERQAFDTVEALLNAIAQGQVMLAPPPQPTDELQPVAPPA